MVQVLLVYSVNIYTYYEQVLTIYVQYVNTCQSKIFFVIEFFCFIYQTFFYHKLKINHLLKN